MNSQADIRRLTQAVYDLRTMTEVLNGSRQRGAQKQRAVRVADLRSLEMFPRRAEGIPKISGAPTAAEYNALVDVVQTLYEALGAVSMALNRR